MGIGALLALSACDNGPSAVASREVADHAAPSAGAGPAARDEAGPRADAVDRRSEPALKVDGEPMWAATRRYTAREGAQRTFERNGEAFGAGSVENFVRKAHDFVSHPPGGVEKIERANGDTLLYDRGRNIFAVANKDGLPKTMFKPDDGAAYWDKQKNSPPRRQTARAAGGGDEG